MDDIGEELTEGTKGLGEPEGSEAERQYRANGDREKSEEMTTDNTPPPAGEDEKACLRASVKRIEEKTEGSEQVQERQEEEQPETRASLSIPKDDSKEATEDTAHDHVNSGTAKEDRRPSVAAEEEKKVEPTKTGGDHRVDDADAEEEEEEKLETSVEQADADEEDSSKVDQDEEETEKPAAGRKRRRGRPTAPVGEVRRSTRPRSAVPHYSPTSTEPASSKVVEETPTMGNGDEFASSPTVFDALNKMKVTDDVLMSLHRAMYRGVGQKNSRKDAVMAWRGVPSEPTETEVNRMRNCFRRLGVPQIKNICKMLHIDYTTKEEVIVATVNILVHPKFGTGQSPSSKDDESTAPSLMKVDDEEPTSNKKIKRNSDAEKSEDGASNVGEAEITVKDNAAADGVEEEDEDVEMTKAVSDTEEATLEKENEEQVSEEIAEKPSVARDSGGSDAAIYTTAESEDKTQREEEQPSPPDAVLETHTEAQQVETTEAVVGNGEKRQSEIPCSSPTPSSSAMPLANGGSTRESDGGRGGAQLDQPLTSEHKETSEVNTSEPLAEFAASDAHANAVAPSEDSIMQPESDATDDEPTTKSAGTDLQRLESPSIGNGVVPFKNSDSPLTERKPEIVDGL